MGANVLFKASVPNTYHVTQVQLRVGMGRIHAEQVEVIDGPASVCECGRLRPRAKRACSRCAEMEARRENPLLGVLLTTLRELGGDASLAALTNCIECTNTNMIASGLRSLELSGAITRRWHASARGGRWIYSLKE